MRPVYRVCTAVELELDTARACLHSLCLRVEPQFDAIVAKCVREDVGRLRLDAGQEVLAVLDESDLGADASVELGELAADRSASEDNEAIRDLVRARRLAARPVIQLIE